MMKLRNAFLDSIRIIQDFEFFSQKYFCKKLSTWQFLQNWFFWSEEVLVVSVKILILDIGLDDSYLVWFFI